ncbi:Suppressor of G2 allele of SKP1 [Desmophyllum pertusum]|uniref:Suppressor of G2 allele of SKP1 n=1 Tax=Desmophyllum pertusum TaxID=174260 RepID=A0A9X0CJD3_9CNID|nr:Suppressor of G2 allele of SKP1 [Desmophyllum pertusum]
MAGSELVREGNEAFVDDDYELAIKKYSEAIELNAYDAEFYLKRAAAFMKLANYQAAAADTSSAHQFYSLNIVRHTQEKDWLFLNLKISQLAKEAFSDALNLDKENKELKMWIRKCVAELDLAANEAKTGSKFN